MVAPALVSARLAPLAATRGGQPLLTHYGEGNDRTELSVASFANWVDKTANLLDDLGLDDGAVVALPVLVERPAHWMGLVWPFALWRAGLAAHVVARADAAGADLAVIGPLDPAPVGRATLACSLHPWGLPLRGLPAGVDDYASEALAQPDAAPVPAVPDAAAAAWVDAHGVRTHGEVASAEPIADRVVAAPADAWAAVSLLVRAVLGGGSVVFVDGPDADPARVADAERARQL